MNDYLIVIEKIKTGFSAFSPDFPGCIATGKTKKDVERKINDALEFHIEGLKLEGESIPQSKSYSIYKKLSNEKRKTRVV
ncbi:MAG: type II toxin-antitoxin system HicB family antitoxin [Melioribacteraceae bacterium]|nr:MAG: type II toxin-antitoxin system HicB family antitoxin [Melioribacteraceae bacterium]